MIRLLSILFLLLVGSSAFNMQTATTACAAEVPDGMECLDREDLKPLDKVEGTCINFDEGSSEYTAQVVRCVEQTIQEGVSKILSAVASEGAWVYNTLCVVAFAFVSFRMISADPGWKKPTATLLLKIAFVGAFMNMLSTVATWPFSALSDLLTVASGGAPWAEIDEFMSKIFGFGEEGAMVSGLLGLIGAAIFSSTVGVMMFFTGIFAILNLILFCMRLVYIYLLSYLTIGFLVAFTPVTIPLILLSSTDRFFKRWVALIISAILTPVLLFAFVGMMIGILTSMLNDVYDIIGKDFTVYFRTNQPVYSWLMPSDPNTTQQMQGIDSSRNPDKIKDTDVCHVSRNPRPPTQLNINPLARNSVDVSIAQTSTVDFGANDVKIVQELSMVLTLIWLFATFMKSAVEQIPYLAASLAGARTGISGQSAVLDAAQGQINKAEGQLRQNVANDGSKFDNIKALSSQITKMVGRR